MHINPTWGCDRAIGLNFFPAAPCNRAYGLNQTILDRNIARERGGPIAVNNLCTSNNRVKHVVFLFTYERMK
jgi:hypothetical protein